MAASGDKGSGRSPRGWADRVTVIGGPDGYAYRPREVLTTGGDEVLNRVEELGASAETVGRIGSFSHLRLAGDADVAALVQDLRLAGFTAQPNHVFFADCGCACSCPPHPADRCGGASASPVYASPVYASPVYASPVYASPVYASPVYASGQTSTGLRRSSARPAPNDVSDPVRTRIAAATGGGPRVVVLDTGLAGDGLCPPVLSPHCAPSHPTTDVDPPDSDPADDRLDPAAGHGTFIGGLILQVAPSAQVTVTRVLSGLGDGDEASIAGAIHALVGQVDVLNLSFSGYVLDAPGVIAEAIRSVQRGGAVVVASAGNDGTCRPTYPAALPGVVGVGAVGPSGPARFSNYGPWVRACAPGVDLVSTFFNGFEGGDTGEVGSLDPDNFYGFATWSGTSFSAPVVAGAIAREMAAGATGGEAVSRVVDGPHLLRIDGLGTVVNTL